MPGVAGHDHSRSFKLEPIYVRFRRKQSIELVEGAFDVARIARYSKAQQPFQITDRPLGVSCAAADETGKIESGETGPSTLKH